MVASATTDAPAPEIGELSAPSATEHDDTIDISDDDLFHLLQNYRRRAVVKYLQGRSGTVRMRDVAEQVAAWEHETSLQALTSKQRQRVYIALYQSHLDTLADAGLIEYNKPRGIIEPKPPLDTVANYLDAAEPTEQDDHNHNWTNWYLAASGFSAVLVGSASTGLAFSTYLSSMVVGLLTVAMFTSITIANVLTDVV